MSMQKSKRLIDCGDFPELDIVEREATLEPAMKLGILLHLAGLSLSDAVSVLEYWGVERYRTPFTTEFRGPVYSPRGAMTESRCA